MAVIADEQPTLTEQLTWFMTTGDPRRGELNVDPFPFLERLRTHDPMLRTPHGSWFASEYALVEAVCRHEAFSLERLIGDDEHTLAERIFHRSMPFRDPPAHSRLRKAALPFFTPRAIRRTRERVATRVRELLEPHRDEHVFDFRSFALALPISVIGDMLGLPPREIMWFNKWAMTAREMRALDRPTPEAMARADETAREAIAYFDGVIADRRRHPGDDLVTSFLALEDAPADTALTLEEIVAMCVILHVGGHSTTSSLMTIGLYHLLRDQDAYQALRADPTLVPGAVDELLRYDTPIPVALRTATRDVEIGGHTVARGERVVAHLAAGNRDPKRFENPNRIDVRRRDNHHLTFSSGIHVCLGAHLARLEAQEALTYLVTEMPEIELAVKPDDLVWENSFTYRGVASLDVAWA